MASTESSSFVIKDCALLPIATGRRAHNLRELRDNLLTVELSSIYYHFWGGLLRPRFDNPEYNNDFAVWAAYELHDKRLAERLGVINPADFKDFELLRRELVEVIEERLDESEFVPWAKPDRQFHFIRAQMVVFDTRDRIAAPEKLPMAVPNMTVSSIFYHFIDARRHSPDGMDDFRSWLAGLGPEYTELDHRLAAVDPYFVTLAELRQQLAGLFNDYFGEERQ